MSKAHASHRLLSRIASVQSEDSCPVIASDAAEPLQCSIELDEELVAQINNSDHTIYDEFASRTGLKRSQVKMATKKGALWLARGAGRFRRVRRLRSARVGERYALNYHPAILAEVPEPPVLVEDCGSYSVWDKPAGMLSQPSKWADHTSICRVVEQRLDDGRQAFLVHRLDKMTSGLMVVSHQPAVTRQLAAAFEKRQVKKSYQCIVMCLPSEVVEQTIVTDLDGKSALTVIKSVEKAEKLLNLPRRGIQAESAAEAVAPSQCSLLSVSIETGRKHQIRRHLSSIGATILGDRHYSDSLSPPFEDIDLQLRAVSLQFICPVSGCEKAWDIK